MLIIDNKYTRYLFDKNNNLIYLLGLTFLFVLLSLKINSPAHATNLIVNPGFESGANNIAANWIYISRKAVNSIQWVSDDVHSGIKALKMVAVVPEDSGRSMGVYSDFITIPEDVSIEMKAWVKALNVVPGEGYFQGRVIIYCYDSLQTQITSYNNVRIDGGILNWAQIRTNIITPAGTKYIKVAFLLTTCTGTVWVDDVELSIIQQAPTVSLAGIYNPVVIPTPAQSTFGNNNFSIGSMAVVIDTAIGKQSNLEEEIKEYFLQIGISNYKLLSPGSVEIAQYKTQFIIGDLLNTVDVVNRFKVKYPDKTPQDAGNQGYFLSVVDGGAQNKIYLGANSEQGRFYGFQTLKQLISTKTEPTIYNSDIFDFPTLDRRGLAMGVQWFSLPEKAIARLSSLKGNHVVNEGSYLNYKFSTKWREDFTSSELINMQAYLSICNKHFVVPRLNFGPRSSDPTVNPVIFSSDTEINLIVEKIKKLYAIGYRCFGLNFDDLENIGQDKLLVESDKTYFGNDIGKAHSYFTQNVFNRIKEVCSDIDFTVLTMKYGDNFWITSYQQSYLSAFASLPSQIKLITATVTDEGIQNNKKLTNRTITIWNNFYFDFDSPSTVSKGYTWMYQNLINWNDEIIKNSVDGLIFLSILPANEDPSLVSWKTAADFLWSPVRYSPINSFQNAMAQYTGVGDRVSLNPPTNITIK